MVLFKVGDCLMILITPTIDNAKLVMQQNLMQKNINIYGKTECFLFSIWPFDPSGHGARISSGRAYEGFNASGGLRPSDRPQYFGRKSCKSITYSLSSRYQSLEQPLRCLTLEILISASSDILEKTSKLNHQIQSGFII